jgi:hypothetical protein
LNPGRGSICRTLCSVGLSIRNIWFRLIRLSPRVRGIFVQRGALGVVLRGRVYRSLFREWGFMLGLQLNIELGTCRVCRGGGGGGIGGILCFIAHQYKYIEKA